MESSLGHLPPQLLHRPKGVAGGNQLYGGATLRVIFRFKLLGLDGGINLMESSFGHRPPQLLHRPKRVAGGNQLHGGATPSAIF